MLLCGATVFSVGKTSDMAFRPFFLLLVSIEVLFDILSESSKNEDCNAIHHLTVAGCLANLSLPMKDIGSFRGRLKV
jgi:hypothetical protein